MVTISITQRELGIANKKGDSQGNTPGESPQIELPHERPQLGLLEILWHYCGNECIFIENYKSSPM